MKTELNDNYVKNGEMNTMTFDEWFDKEYPEEIFECYQMARETIKDIMSVAWAAAQGNIKTSWDFGLDDDS